MHHSKSIYTAFSRIKAHLFVKSIWEGEKRRNAKIRDNTQICWFYSEIKNKLKKQKKVQNSNTGCEWNTRILFHAHKTFQLNTLWLASYYKIQLYWGFSLCTFLVLFEWWTRFLLWESFFESKFEEEMLRFLLPFYIKIDIHSRQKSFALQIFYSIRSNYFILFNRIFQSFYLR